MPVYSAKTSSLIIFGPILDVQLQAAQHAQDAMTRAGQAIPPPVTVAALIDTGASCTVIKQGLPAQLGLLPIGVQHVNTPTSQNVPCYQYAIRILFPSTAGIRIPVNFETVIMEAPLQGQNIQCLIGRDFLQHAILVYSGPDDMFTLSM